ncbi:MAG: porin [Aureliella sp.]
MKITKFALAAAIAAGCLGSKAQANDFGYYSSDPAPVEAAADVGDYASVIPAACSCTDAPVSNCDVGCGDFSGGCDSACDGMGGCSDEPWTLFQNDILGFTVGGWTSIGYHSANNSLFNQHDGNVNLNQAWLYAEKVADGSCGLGFGGRIDYVYGVDAQDTQAFGIANGHWDEGWDNGIYGHAIPQLYAEAAYGDLSVKVGHFYTLIGYEVVGAPGNFFYSHAYTMFNSEPFTHTGALATYNMGDGLTTYGGYVMGWDSGFDDNGDAFLGGFSYDLSDNMNITNQYIIGRFGEGAASEAGFMTSSILTTQLTDNVTHVFWVDLLDTDGTGRAVERETFDITNYLLVGLTDNVTWGQRLEYYNVDKGVYGVNAGRSDVYAYTTGLNVGLGTNLLLRPEIRWDWDKDRVAGLENNRAAQTTFGSDLVFTF